MSTRLLIALIATLLIVPSHSQTIMKKSAIKAFESTCNQQILPIIENTLHSQTTDNIGKAYGVRVYGDGLTGNQQFVSFDLSNPGEITIEKELENLYIRAAAYADGTYYMINSDDGMVAYDLIALNIATMEILTIASYDLYAYGSALIFLDMAFDCSTDTMYGLAYDLETGITTDNEDEVEIEMALVEINLETGEITCVGHQNLSNLITIAFDENGSLWALDMTGELWEINKSNGKLIDAYGYTLDSPSSLQSMTFNPNNNQLYWTGFSISSDTTGNQIGNGFLSKFIFKEDTIVYERIADLESNSEIVGLYIDPNPLPDNALDAPTEVNLIVDNNGFNKATVTWNNPIQLLNKESITESFSIAIYRNEEKVATLENMKSGEAHEWIDETAPTGFNRYKIVGINSAGEGKASYSENLYIGHDIPGVVESLFAKKVDNKDEIFVEWNQPVNGKNGGWFDKTSLSYTVVRYPDGKLLLDKSFETSFTDSGFDSLYGYSYKVTASNNDGVGDEIESNAVVVGPATNVPYTCDFSTEDAVRTWTVIDEDNDGMSWFASKYTSIDQSFMKYAPETKYNPATSASDWLISPPINLVKGESYIFSYDLFLLGDLFPFDYSVTIGSKASAESQTTILSHSEDLIIDMTFTPQAVVFNVDTDGIYYIGIHVENAVLAQITNIKLETLADLDLTAQKIEGLVIGNINSPMSFNVTVKNTGADEINKFVVDLLDDSDKVLSSNEIQQTIKTQEVSTAKVEFTPGTVGLMKIRARVSTKNDALETNNYTEPLNITVLESGDWVHITSGEALMNYTPFITSAKESSAYTIYTSDLIGYSKGTIKGLAYYYWIFNNWQVNDFSAKIYLTNTTDKEFGTFNRIDKNNMTLVYDGIISIDPDASMLYIQFDTDFDYTGENLCILSEYKGDGYESPLMFYGNREIMVDNESSEITYCMWYSTTDNDGNNETAPETELVNVSLFMTETVDVQEVNPTDNTIKIVDNRIYVNNEFIKASVYTISGQIIATHEYDNQFSISDLTTGIYIVEIITRETRHLKKIIVNNR